MQTGEDAEFEVEPRWKEEVVYWEGAEGFVFDAGWGVDPPVLYIPFPEEWDAVTAPWMHGRRDEIVERLRRHSRHRIEPGPYPGPGRRVTR
ncbi:hypothetical protein [Plantibacter cousiniae (nom. nud.)]|uniref:hypothetical protein n=1 Tax=Plantibacter cousiniae (nom. nud.) TaxID=199709 RepID=UPI001E5C8416|nr:hypothetical protein [Plantibacter cousiniae]